MQHTHAAHKHMAHMQYVEIDSITHAARAKVGHRRKNGYPQLTCASVSTSFTEPSLEKPIEPRNA